MKTLFGIFATCILLALPFSSANAKDLGLEVKSIPKRTVAHYVDSGGRKFTYTFLGKTGNLYLVRVSGSRNYTRFYDANGFLVRNRWSDYKIEFRPHDCSRKLGKCHFYFDSLYSKYDGNWNTKLRKTKEGYEFTYFPINKNQPPIGPIYFKYGKYNFISEYVAGSSWFRLVKIVTPK